MMSFFSKYKNKFLKISIFLIVFSFLLLLIIYSNHYEFSLNGDVTVNVEYLTKYKDEGAKLKRCILFYCQDISSKLKVKNDIDSSKIGEYEVKYSYKDKSITRKVNVIESVAPVITLKGPQKINACLGHEYVEEGYTALDNYDGDLTAKVEKEIKGNTIYYTVYDSSNNKGEATRTFNYNDSIAPTISLNGAKIIYLNKGDPYQEPGFVATDNCNGDLTAKVIIKGKVDSSKGNTYTLTYTVTDFMGNTTSVNRQVIVLDFDTKNVDSYIATLENYINNKGYHVSIGYYNIAKNYTYKYNADKIYYGASLIKTLDALYVYENMEVTADLKTLVKPLIEKSDNTAHFNLVKKIGFENLKNYGQKMGAKHVLTRGSSDYYANTCVDDQLIYMKYLYGFINNSQIPMAKRAELKSYFINDYYNYLLFPGIPETMHKYGYFGAYYHDVGIVFADSPYIVVILTTEANRDFKIVTDLSQKIYNLNELL